MYRLLILLFLFLVFKRPSAAQTGGGFRALEQSNYAKAKGIFKRNTWSSPVLGHYGMSLYFADGYNRFHSFDSAYFHANRSLMYLPHANFLERIILRKKKLDHAFLGAHNDFIYRQAF